MEGEREEEEGNELEEDAVKGRDGARDEEVDGWIDDRIKTQIFKPLTQ